MDRRRTLGFLLVVVGVIGLLAPNVLPSREYDIAQAVEISEAYLASLNDPDLAIAEIMEFEQNFYVVFYEESTRIGAFEMLIDKETGRIFPEYGPNMMWNTKYGHHGGMMGGRGGMMGGGSRAQVGDILVGEGQAMLLAQEFLDEYYPGAVAEDAHPFYGYYTIHVERDGRVFGMLSVNGYDGEVWYHDWHGEYVQSREMH